MHTQAYVGLHMKCILFLLSLKQKIGVHQQIQFKKYPQNHTY
jgi:hypothetical protein